MAAAERTTLAWERSAVAYSTLGALLLGAAAHRDEPWLLAPALALVVVAGLVWRHAHSAKRRPGARRPPRLLALVTVLTGLVAVVAALAQGPA